jgi:hypothetical protein
MDDLPTVLGQLEDVELVYVWERSKTTSNSQALTNAGIPASTFYGWPREKQEQLNKLAQELKRNRLLAAEMVLVENAERAARTLTQHLDSESERIAQSAATDILDRTAGKPVQRSEVSDDEFYRLGELLTKIGARNIRELGD